VDKDIPSKYYLESEQQEFVEDISQAKEKLKMLAAASPSEIVSKDEDPLYRLYSLSSTVDYLVETICESQKEFTKYQNMINILEQWEYASKPHVLVLDIHNKEDMGKILKSDYVHTKATMDEKNPFRTKSYANIQDYISDLEKNLQARTIQTKRDLFIAYYKDELVIDEEMNILYNSEEEAYEAIYKMMEYSAGTLFFDKYLQQNSQLYDYFLSVLTDDAKTMLTTFYNAEGFDYKLLTELSKHIDTHIHSLISKNIRIVKIA
jgi:hypothetical protein